MKILPYTFRTNSFKEELAKVYHNLFVFEKLTEDFIKFCELIKKEKPNLILGVARSKNSEIETFAVNKFNRTKKIILDGPEKYTLYTPNINLDFSQNMKSSFCNWTAYKISNFINEEKLNIKISFIHLNIKDLQKLKELK